MKARYFLILLTALIFTACNSQTKGVETIPPPVFAEKIKTKNAQVLDVRTPEEFNSGHLKSADNVDWNSGNFESLASKYDKSKPVFVYCRVGGRSAKAAKKLNELGFTQVYDLEGGILNWSSEKYPVTEPKK